MTLLASERSMLIRSKFRSVLQLRIQHRRSQEQMSEQNMQSGNKPQPAFSEPNGNLGQSNTEDFMKCKAQDKLHKLVAVKMPFSQGQISSSAEAFAFDDDSSASSSPCFALSPGHSNNLSPTSTNTDFQVIAKHTDMGKKSKQKKSKDIKPKVKKLKYHQYVPPDQKAERSSVVVDAAYSRLLQQQQVFLQLQILNQQQNKTFCVQTIHPLTASVSADQLISFTKSATAGTPNINICASPSSTVTTPIKLDLLSANLDDLTVSELRQHLRKRGLPVSGTKPALLERLRPYQVPGAKAIPNPIPSENLITSAVQFPSFSSTSTCDTTLETQISPSPSTPPNGFSKLSETTRTIMRNPESQKRIKDNRMQEIDDDLVLMEKQKVIENLTWKLLQEQRQAQDLRVELEMHKRLKNRCKNKKQSPPIPVNTEVNNSLKTSTKAQNGDTHCLSILSNDRPEETTDMQGSPRSPNNNYMIFQPSVCELIGQDVVLPMQFTESKESPVQKTRSFEEELQEAIHKEQMAFTPSIEDILEEPLLCTDDLIHVDNDLENMIISESNTPIILNGSSTKTCIDAQSKLNDSKFLEFPMSANLDLLNYQDNFSLIFSGDHIEMPSPPEHLENNMSLLSSSSSHVQFDPAEWLEDLTSGTANACHGNHVASSIFSTDIFDSPDLSINRMIDLMAEQW